MIIFVRNGENSNHQAQEFQSPYQKATGYQPLSLSENGKKQAFKRAKEIKTLINDYCNEVDLQPKEINITICSSPFQKCLETAQIIKTNIQDHEIKMKKKNDIIYSQIELGDYRHPQPTKKQEIESELHDFAYSYDDVTKEKFLTNKYLSSEEYLLYEKDTDDTERKRIASFFNELVYKQGQKQKEVQEIFIVVTHRFAIEIVVDIFEGDQKLCESGLIAIKNNVGSNFGIYRVGEVFKMEKQK